MAISLQGRQRQKLRGDLLAHRESFFLSDADYVARVLKVSLNTWKKCIVNEGGLPLSLSRRTLLSIFANAGLNPRDYGLRITLPTRGSPFGGYIKRDYGFLCGRFFMYRRSFLTAQNINRIVLDITMNESKECLSFREIQYYVSDAGARDEHQYAGDVHIDHERSLLGFPSSTEGQTRLMLVGMPQRPMVKERITMRGTMLTYGQPRGHWQPTTACVFIEGPQEIRHPNPRELSGTIYPEMAEYGRLSAELAHTEAHATIQTPLLWRGLRTSAPPRASMAAS